MIRTQVQLTEDQARRLKRTATERGVSIAEVIREAVDLHLGRTLTSESHRQRAIRAVGGFRSGRHDISTRHDDDLADALAE